MFSLYHKPNFSANADPNPAMSDCCIQAFRMLTSVCCGISIVSRVRFRAKVTVRD